MSSTSRHQQPAAEPGEQLGAAITFLLTWGTIPSIYYRDEIGMRYLTGLPNQEGSIWSPGFNRAGCRTPMQWDNSLRNAGFSNADPSQLYLPQDPEPDRPTVAALKSTLNRFRRLIQLRRDTPELRTDASAEVLYVGYPLVYRRGDRHLVVVNPAGTARSVDIPVLKGLSAQPLEVSGAQVRDGRAMAEPFSYGVFELRS